MKTTIVWQPEDKSLPQLILECTYNAWDGEPMIQWGDNPYPGSPPGVEVESVECVDVDEEGVMLGTAFLGKIIGALCWQADRKGIERAVMESHCEESQGDPDRERD